MSRNIISLIAGLSLTVTGLTLAGCSDSPSTGRLATQPSVAQLQAARGIEASYVYYPDYELYYSSNYALYVYRANGTWTVQTHPPQLPPGTLENARAVPMNFHDDPRGHTEEISRQYPAESQPHAAVVANP